MEADNVQDGADVYRVAEPAQMHYRASEETPGDAGDMLEGRMMPYGEWTEIRSTMEGHFLERFSPGALAKSMSEQKARIRVLFEHGMDKVLGRQAIADIADFEDLPDGAHYRAALLPGLPQLVTEGLRRGLYGSSIYFHPIPGKVDRVGSPRASEHNPEGLPEVTVREARIKEFSVVLFPAYEGATAHVRSMTDEVHARQLLEDPVRLLELLTARTATTTAEPEPQHSGPDDQQEEAPPVVVESRRTQPKRDWLKPEEGRRSWI